MGLAEIGIKRQGLPEQVAEQLEGLIAAGEVAVGDRLPPERDLAERLACSRSVVREAVKSLAMRGLVSIEQGRGTFVTKPDASDAAEGIARLIRLGAINDLQEKVRDMRLALEPAIAKRAAQRVSPEDLHAIESCLLRMQTALPDAQAYLQADVDFHLALAQAAGNELFSVIIEPVVDLVRSHIEGRISNRQKRIRESLVEHQAILDAVKAGDGDSAAAHMHVHLESQ